MHKLGRGKDRFSPLYLSSPSPALSHCVRVCVSEFSFQHDTGSMTNANTSLPSCKLNYKSPGKSWHYLHRPHPSRHSQTSVGRSQESQWRLPPLCLDASHSQNGSGSAVARSPQGCSSRHGFLRKSLLQLLAPPFHPPPHCTFPQGRASVLQPDWRILHWVSSLGNVSQYLVKSSILTSCFMK